MYNEIFFWTLFLLYIVFNIIVIVGAGFITNSLFTSTDDQLEGIGITSGTQRDISKMSIVMFWILYIPLLIISIIYYFYKFS